MIILKLLYIGFPTTLLGGAEARSFNTLRYYPEFFVDVYLYIPITYLMYYFDVLASDELRKELLRQLDFLQKWDVHVDNNIIEILDNVRIIDKLIDGKGFLSLKRLLIFKTSPLLLLSNA